MSHIEKGTELKKNPQGLRPESQVIAVIHNGGRGDSWNSGLRKQRLREKNKDRINKSIGLV